MNYVPRIAADDEYLRKLGRAFYNFTYLEWIVIWTIARLNGSDFTTVPQGRGATASRICAVLTNAIERATPPLTAPLAQALGDFRDRFEQAIDRRNKLLHAHPFTAGDGSQQLGYEGASPGLPNS